MSSAWYKSTKHSASPSHNSSLSSVVRSYNPANRNFTTCVVWRVAQLRLTSNHQALLRPWEEKWTAETLRVGRALSPTSCVALTEARCAPLQSEPCAQTNLSQLLSPPAALFSSVVWEASFLWQSEVQQF